MWLPGTKDTMPEFLNEYCRLAPKIYEFIRTLQIFLVPIICETRIRKRIEGAIAKCLYDHQKENGKIFIEEEDRNRLCRRTDNEKPIKLRILHGERIDGLASELIL
jgi:hypothetical protein